MENSNNIMYMGLGALLFSVAVILAVSMYSYVDSMIERTEKTISVRKVLEGE